MSKNGVISMDLKKGYLEDLEKNVVAVMTGGVQEVLESHGLRAGFKDKIQLEKEIYSIVDKLVKKLIEEQS